MTDGQTYFSEEKRDARSETSQVAPGIPAYRIRNTAVDGRYRIEKEVLTDPWRDVVLQRVRFVPLQGTLADFRLYVLLAPHLANRGSGNTAWVGDYKGTPMLFAERDQLRARAGLLGAVARPIGRVRRRVGWMAGTAGQQTIDPDLHCAQRTETSPSRAKSISRIGRHVRARARFRSDGDGSRSARAHQPARRFRRDASGVRQSVEGLARETQKAALPPKSRTAAVSHSARRCCARTNRNAWKAAIIASLSIPWGFSKGDDDLGGYHLVWPRDLVETAGGFLAVGAHEHVEARACGTCR